MGSKEPSPSFRSFSYESEIERTKWYKEDLDKGNGWIEVHRGLGVTYWKKTISGEEIPMKILFTQEMPMPAESFAKLLYDQKNQEKRNEWDSGFKEHATLEVYPNDSGFLVWMRSLIPWPLADRGYCLYIPEIREIDWYGQKSLFILVKNGWHPSRPANANGCVRATNGGNFYVVTPDDKDPGAKCKVFGLSNNNYNGWIPEKISEWLVSRVLPKTFNKLRDDMIDAYKKY